MNFFKKIIKKKKKEENKQECWYNNAHEGSAGNAEALPCDVNGGASMMEYTIAKNIAQK